MVAKDHSIEETVSSDMAWSILFESLARIFSYPQQSLFDEIQSGQLLHLLAQCLRIIEAEPALISRIEDLDHALQKQFEQQSYAELEPQYIALFELNRNVPPLHLNAHLYKPNYDQQNLLQKLMALYRENGLEIKAGQSADHLCVQLNFMAWLYRQADSSDEKTSYHDTIRAFQQQLLWLRQFTQQLEARHHWLYSPMSQFLLLLVPDNDSERD